MKVSSGSFISAIIHGCLLAVMIVDLPASRPEAEEPEAIQVELVPPVKKAEPKPPEKPNPVAEQAAKPKENKLDEQPKVKAPRTLRPVYKFAEKNEGADKPAENDADLEEKTAEASPAEKPIVEQAEKKPEPVSELGSGLEAAANKPPPPEPAAVEVAILRPTKPVARPPKQAKPARTSRTTRSRPKNKNSVATTAKRNTARSVRAGSLCVTELKSQLQSSARPRWPDLLPTYRLPNGNVLQVNRGAFRENGRWINLQFRCEIDKAATQVVAFNFVIGTPIPRAQWRARGLPGS